VKQVLTDHAYKPDLQAARALYAGIAAHRLSGTPVWPMLVAPPGSLKTELLGALSDFPGVHFVDQFTSKTFISGKMDDPGKPRQASPSLLKRIGAEGILVCPDFSTLLGGKQDSRESVFADLRRIYDGQLSKEFGTGENLEDHKWTGRITVAVAVTPAIDGYSGAFQSLGERFIMIRWPRADGPQAALIAMDQDTVTMRVALKAAVHGLINGLPALQPDVPSALKHQIAHLAEVIARGRTHVQRNTSKQIIELPQVESPTRLAQQFVQLSRGSALLSGRFTVEQADFDLVYRVALDCLRPARRSVLDTLAKRGSVSDLGIPGSTLQYALDDLEAVGLVKDRQLHPHAVSLLSDAGCYVN
jgi:hypothetical protein